MGYLEGDAITYRLDFRMSKTLRLVFSSHWWSLRWSRSLGPGSFTRKQDMRGKTDPMLADPGYVTLECTVAKRN